MHEAGALEPRAALSSQMMGWTRTSDSCIRYIVMDAQNLVKQRLSALEALQRIRGLLSAEPREPSSAAGSVASSAFMMPAVVRKPAVAVRPSRLWRRANK